MKPSLLPLLLVAGLLCSCGDDPPPASAETAGDAPANSSGVTVFPPDFPLPSAEFLPLTEKIHELVVARPGPATAGEMEPYDESIAQFGDAAITMIPLPGGTVTLGSPAGEAGRAPDEGPPRTVTIAPFWMARTEVTWALYLEFMDNGKSRNKEGTLDLDADIFSRDLPDLDDGTPLVDVISQPTPPYAELHFNMGEGDYNPEYPAISMTQHAASKFCEWLTAHTGHFYRLPTEAEWEYAARAGTSTAYHFGDDPALLDAHAWFGDNSDETYHPVAKKQPNAWGLYDMHGNASEWVLDGAADTFRESLSEGILNPWPIPQTRYPRLVKGGSWIDPAERLRIAARTPSTPLWKHVDPQVPKSIWYLSNDENLTPTGNPVGFRIIRPLHTPTAREMHLFWNTDWWAPERNAEDL